MLLSFLQDRVSANCRRKRGGGLCRGDGPICKERGLCLRGLDMRYLRAFTVARAGCEQISSFHANLFAPSLQIRLLLDECLQYRGMSTPIVLLSCQGASLLWENSVWLQAARSCMMVQEDIACIPAARVHLRKSKVYSSLLRYDSTCSCWG